MKGKQFYLRTGVGEKEEKRREERETAFIV